MTHNIGDNAFRCTCLFGFCNEPSPEGMEVYEAAALSGAIVFHFQLLAIGCEAFAKNISSVTLVS
jgi:hypothetical protein